MWWRVGDFWRISYITVSGLHHLKKKKGDVIQKSRIREFKVKICIALF